MEEKTFYGNAVVYLEFLNKEQCAKLDMTATSVHCFPVKENELLFTLNPRGLDIIGGHVEGSETPEETLIREAKEEACIIPLEYELIGAIQVDNRDNPEAVKQGYPEKGYQFFYLVTDYKELPFEQTHECTNRQYVSFEKIAKQHHKWLNTHQAIIEEAKKILCSKQVLQNIKHKM